MGVSDKLRREVLDSQDWECWLCGRDLSDESVEGHIHHLRRRDSGGKDKFSNLVALCQRCHIHSGVSVHSRS